MTVCITTVTVDFAVMLFITKPFDNFHFAEPETAHNLAYCPGCAFVPVELVGPFDEFAAGFLNSAQLVLL